MPAKIATPSVIQRDARTYCSLVRLLAMKRRYTSFYIHRAAAFAFTGFASTLANYQLGYVGLVATALETVSVKPKSITKITNLNFDSV